MRRLAAILAADVVGYSRLMGADEAGTLDALRALRFDIVEPSFKRHRGRIAKLMGDGVLAEFSSVVDAVAAAVEIQGAIPNRFKDLPQDREIQVRIGINVGDIVVEDGDIFGDGVNIAARLQEVAKPGGIALSENAHRELRGKLDLPFEEGGSKTLKNIQDPVNIWLWPPGNNPVSSGGFNSSSAVSERPSIAVLPFEHMSSDTEQELLADGMAEDIIAGLSKFRWLFVIARRSSFTYKDQSKDVRKIAEELGVRYVLEGSLRRAGNRLRVTADLVDAEMANQVWSERLDRELEDLFEIQDELSRSIIAKIAPEISQSEIERARQRPPNNLDAWSNYQQGIALYSSGARKDFEVTIDLFDRAYDLDPNFVDAISMAALQRLRMVFFFRPSHSNDLIGKASDLLQRAMRMDARNAHCHSAFGRLNWMQGEYDLAVSMCTDAVELNPNSVLSHIELAMAYTAQKDWSGALRQYDTVVALSPRDPHLAGAYSGRAYSLFNLGCYEDCIEAARKSSRSQNPRFWGDVSLVSALTVLGRNDQAEEAKKALLARKPDFTISALNGMHAFDSDAYRDALRKAGLPD